MYRRMFMNQNLLSIITPVYQVEQYLPHEDMLIATIPIITYLYILFIIIHF